MCGPFPSIPCWNAALESETPCSSWGGRHFPTPTQALYIDFMPQFYAVRFIAYPLETFRYSHTDRHALYYARQQNGDGLAHSADLIQQYGIRFRATASCSGMPTHVYWQHTESKGTFRDEWSVQPPNAFIIHFSGLQGNRLVPKKKVPPILKKDTLLTSQDPSVRGRGSAQTVCADSAWHFAKSF